MGDIIFTAKKITEQSKLATWIADGGNMHLSAMGVVSQKGDAGVDLLIGDVPDKPVEETKSKCIAHIRPTRSWKGSFGFDWFRLGDTRLDGDVLYDDLIGRYYTKDPAAADTQTNTDSNSWTKFFQKDPQPQAFRADDRLNRLKSLYGWFNYSIKKDSSGKPVVLPYYFPRLALFAQKIDGATKKIVESGTAELVLQVEFEKVAGKEVKPIRLQFEMDGQLMDDKHPLVSVDPAKIETKNIGSKVNIKITCKNDFAEDKEVKIWAITLDKDGKEEHELAGMLKMIAPLNKVVKDVVIVVVKTSAGLGNSKGQNELIRNLKQGLINVNLVSTSNSREAIIIDVTRKENNYQSIDFNIQYGVVGSDIIKSEGITRGAPLLDFLDGQLNKTHPGKYTDHFKLYFLKNTCNKKEEKDDTGTVTGVSSTLGFYNLNTKHGIMFLDHTPSTIGHECLHGLGLNHTFCDDLFTYKAMQTDNIMDYSHLALDKITKATRTPIGRISSNYWQWKIINEKIT
ncbi:hypothetical protein H7F33_16945 [Pedobacter sp. PAMC26386]|nr:hypothetical protein H7F33_16945 [Pedobacter sp. PAMC26386]